MAIANSYFDDPGRRRSRTGARISYLALYVHLVLKCLRNAPNASPSGKRIAAPNAYRTQFTIEVMRLRPDDRRSGVFMELNHCKIDISMPHPSHCIEPIGSYGGRVRRPLRGMPSTDALFNAKMWSSRYDPRFGLTFPPGTVQQYTNSIDYWQRTMVPDWICCGHHSLLALTPDQRKRCAGP